MSRPKFEVGERVEMLCPHWQAGQVVTDWLAGQVVQSDFRMAAVRFEQPVFSSTGFPIPDRVLWCTHGSRNLRRPASQDAASETREVNSDD